MCKGEKIKTKVVRKCSLMFPGHVLNCILQMKEKEILQSFHIVRVLCKRNLFTFQAGYIGDFNAFSK